MLEKVNVECSYFQILDVLRYTLVNGLHVSVCFQLHGDTITSQQDLVTAAKQVQETQTLSWQHLQDSFNQSLCLVSYLKTAAL